MPKGMPKELVGADYIKMFNNDKCRTDFRLNVKLAGPSCLYVFIDDRVPVPDWVARQFEPTGWTVGMHENPIPTDKARQQSSVAADADSFKRIDNTFTVWRLFVPQAQTVELGPSNINDPERDRPLGQKSQTSMYGIAAVAQA